MIAFGRSTWFGPWFQTPALVLTLREAVRAWLAAEASVTAVVGNRIYFAVPSQLSAYPCLAVLVSARKYGHNLAGADGSSTATVELVGLGLRESDVIAIAEAVRNFADGFRGTQSGLAILSCYLEDEEDPMPVPPPDGSANWIYQVEVDYRIKHRVAAPTSVTQTNV